MSVPTLRIRHHPPTAIDAAEQMQLIHSQAIERIKTAIANIASARDAFTTLHTRLASGEIVEDSVRRKTLDEGLTVYGATAREINLVDRVDRIFQNVLIYCAALPLDEDEEADIIRNCTSKDPFAEIEKAKTAREQLIDKHEQLVPLKKTFSEHSNALKYRLGSLVSDLVAQQQTSSVWWGAWKGATVVSNWWTKTILIPSEWSQGIVISRTLSADVSKRFLDAYRAARSAAFDLGVLSHPHFDKESTTEVMESPYASAAAAAEEPIEVIPDSKQEEHELPAAALAPAVEASARSKPKKK